MRGAERTFAAIADCWPEAPILTTLYDPDAMGGRLAGHPVSPSPLQHLRIRQRGFRRLLPVLPWAVSRLDGSEFDVLVSSSSAFAHGIRARDDAVHVCYCHSPFRYAWHERDTGLGEAPAPLRPALALALDRVRKWDVKAHSRVTAHIANGRLTQARIAQYYGRDSVIVHPPVEVDRFAPGTAEDWFLMVGELVSHKRIHVALAAAERAGVAVKVVGEGPELGRWRAAYPRAEFLGRVDDPTLASLYARARALIVPNLEEFGITAVEAMAAGRPVVAPAAGGAGETVIGGETGILLDRGDEDEIAEVLRETDFDRFDPLTTRRNAERFAPDRFRHRLRAEVERVTRRSAHASSAETRISVNPS